MQLLPGIVATTKNVVAVAKENRHTSKIFCQFFVMYFLRRRPSDVLT